MADSLYDFAAVLVTVTLTSIVAATLSRQYYLDLPLSPHLTRDHQYWRLLAHHLAFTNSSELFLGVLLLFFTSPAVERTLGSRKYAVSRLFAPDATRIAPCRRSRLLHQIALADVCILPLRMLTLVCCSQSFLLVVLLLESLLEGVALVVLHKLGLDWLPAGPFGITFAIV